ncbi:hypothetical protein [Vibrio metschnikovii]|uniref:hypothetical protein n=1 Tax=Vibrio metschnikovii TaxID=28172 RepID=UPI002FCA1DD9|nr:hypothetical protein [Vibrio metschnikovii]
MYIYIYDVKTGKVLQKVVSDSFDENPYASYFKSMGVEIGFIRSEVNAQGQVVDGSIIFDL